MPGVAWTLQGKGGSLSSELNGHSSQLGANHRFTHSAVFFLEGLAGFSAAAGLSAFGVLDDSGLLADVSLLLSVELLLEVEGSLRGPLPSLP